MTIRTTLLSACTFVTVTAAVIAPAAAQLEPTAATEAAALGGPELGSILVAPERFEIRVPVGISLSKDRVAEPIVVPLDLYYGINENLTLGLSHSEGVVQAAMPYGFSFGRGICLGGTDGGCGKAYDNLGADVLFGLMKGILQLAAHGGLEMRSIDESLWALRLGLLFQAPLAAGLAIITDPRLSLGLNKRDTINGDYLTLPLAVQVWASPTTRLAVRTVLAGVLDEFDSTYKGALGLFAGIGMNEMVEGFLAFDLTNLYGKVNAGADERVLTLGVNFRM